MSGQFFMLHIMKFDEAISCTFVRNLMEFWIIKIFHVKSIDQELNYAIKLRLLPSFHKTCFALLNKNRGNFKISTAGWRSANYFKCENIEK